MVFNLTATQPSYRVVFSDVAGIDPPGSSTVNFRVGQTAASLAVSAVYDNGWVAVLNPVGNTHAIRDVAGFFTSAGFKPGGILSPRAVCPFR